MTKEEKDKWDALMTLCDRCLAKGDASAAMVYLAEAQKVGRPNSALCVKGQP